MCRWHLKSCPRSGMCPPQWNKFQGKTETGHVKSRQSIFIHTIPHFDNSFHIHSEYKMLAKVAHYKWDIMLIQNASRSYRSYKLGDWRIMYETIRKVYGKSGYKVKCYSFIPSIPSSVKWCCLKLLTLICLYLISYVNIT